jgi:hypothetical protein
MKNIHSMTPVPDPPTEGATRRDIFNIRYDQILGI